MYRNINKSVSIKKILLLILLIIVTLYILMVILLTINESQTFKSNTAIVNVNLENLTVQESIKILNERLANTPVTIVTPDSELTGTAVEFGATIDEQTINAFYSAQSNQYRFMPFSYTKSISLPLKINRLTLISKLSEFPLSNNMVPPKNARINIADDKSVVISSETKGKGIDYQLIADNIIQHFSNSLLPLNVSTNISDVSPAVTKELLQSKMADIHALSTITYNVVDTNNEVIQIPFALLAPTLTLDDTNSLTAGIKDIKPIITYITQSKNSYAIDELTYTYASNKDPHVVQQGRSGKNISNIDTLTQDLISAITNKLPFSGELKYLDLPYSKVTYNLNDKDNTTIKYRIEQWGNTKTTIESFRIGAAQVLNDARGWGNAGVVFEEVLSGEDFSLILSKPNELVYRYPGTCDSFYSCRVGNNVVINDDRWQNATPVWTNSIADYQHLVINHEVGHWLGQGHYYCTIANTPAPVMQQQSIDLKSCTFNSWPLIEEIQQVEKRF